MKATELAKLIINRSYAVGGLITHSKLQLVAYHIYLTYYAQTGEKLIDDERFLANKSEGPYLQSLEKEYLSCAATPLDVLFGVRELKEELPFGLENRIINKIDSLIAKRSWDLSEIFKNDIDPYNKAKRFNYGEITDNLLESFRKQYLDMQKSAKKQEISEIER